MRLFKWTKANAVSIAEIDTGHRTIFEIAEQLHQAIEAEAGPSELRPILRDLATCLEQHFSEEERLMRAARYTTYEWHKGQHDTMRKRMKEFVPRVEQGDAEAAQVLIEFLASWLKGHTSLADRMMGAYLRNHQRAHPVLAS